MQTADPAPRVFIQMLGPFEVFRDDIKMAPTDFGSRKAKTLLRWLADARNTAVSQDVLLDALWPDDAKDRFLRSFRVRISELRKLLAPDKRSDAPLERIDNGYILRTVPGRLETDVDRFSTLASEAMQRSPGSDAIPLLQQCLALYTGEYQSDDPYTEQWYSTRERYRKLFITIAGRLADSYEYLSRYEDGIDLLQRVLGEAHRDEVLYRALIRHQYLSGDQTGALRTYETCRTYLETDLGARPMPETLRLFKQVVRHEPLDVLSPREHQPLTFNVQQHHKSNVQTNWPFLGRQAELNLMQQKISDLERGKGGIVWLHGPSGIGKTRFLKEALTDPVPGNRFRTMWIQGSYLNSHIPFAALLDGLQLGLKPALTREQSESLSMSSPLYLQRLTGWSTNSDSREIHPPGSEPEMINRILLRQEFLRLFEHLAQTTPLVCCIDDVHTLDTASQTLLLALAGRTHHWPLLIIVASRGVPQFSDIGNEVMQVDTPVDVMALEPLSVSALRPLTGRGIPSLWTERWLRKLHAETSGEPMMLIEKLHGLKRRNLIDVADSEVVFPEGLLKLMTDTASVDMSHDILHARKDELQQQWDELDDNHRSLLQKAAALKNALTLQRLKQLSTKSSDTFQHVLEQLIRQGYFSIGGTTGEGHTKLSFSHSRLQNRTYHTLARSERILYHRRIFELLQAEADELNLSSAVDHTRILSAMAFHALLAGHWEAAAEWSMRAAAAAEAISPGPEVVALCRQAFQAARRAEGAKQNELLNQARWALGHALLHVGSYKEALPLFEALTGVPGIDPLLLNRYITIIYLHLNLVDKARAFAERWLAECGDDATTQGRANLNMASVHYSGGELTEAIANSKKATLHFRGDPHRFNRAVAHHQLALSYWDLGEYGHALKHAHESVDLRRKLDVPELINSLNMLGELYQDLFCTARALEIHREALDLSLTQGRVAFSIEIWRNLGLSFIYEGRVEKGLKTLERAWQQVQDLKLVPYWHEVHLRSLLEAKLLAHRPDEVRAHLAEYKNVLGPRETPFVTIFTLALAFLEGRVTEGEAMLSQVRAFWKQTGRRARATHVLLFAGQELLLHGDNERAQTYFDLATEELDRICTLVPEDVALQIRASRQYTAAQRMVNAT